MTPAAFPAGVCIAADDTRTYIVGRLPTVTASPCSGDRRIVLRHAGVGAIEKRDLDRRIGRVRADATRSFARSRAAPAVRKGHRAQRRRARAIGVVPIRLHDPPGADAGRGRTACPDRPRVTTSCFWITRTSSPGSPLTSARSPGVSAEDGITAKCESPRRPSMSASTTAELAWGLRRDGLRPELVADRVPAPDVERRIEMMIADDRPDGVERLGRRGCLRAFHNRRCRNSPRDDRGGRPSQLSLDQRLDRRRQLEDRTARRCRIRPSSTSASAPRPSSSAPSSWPGARCRTSCSPLRRSSW